MKTLEVYAVTTMREYQDGEIYFGCEGVRLNMKDARKLVADGITDIWDLYEDAVYSGDDNRFELRDGSHLFVWEIDQFSLQVDDGSCFASVVWMLDDIINAAASDGVALSPAQAALWWKENERGFKEAITQTGNEMLSCVDWETFLREKGGDANA